MSQPTKVLNVILRISRLKEKTGLSESTLYNKLNPRSKYFDQDFPKPIRLGSGSVGWIEAEVDTWIMSRAELRSDV